MNVLPADDNGDRIQEAASVRLADSSGLKSPRLAKTGIEISPIPEGALHVILRSSVDALWSTGVVNAALDGGFPLDADVPQCLPCIELPQLYVMRANTGETDPAMDLHYYFAMLQEENADA